MRNYSAEILEYISEHNLRMMCGVDEEVIAVAEQSGVEAAVACITA